MTESNVAQDQLKAFVRRIESVEDEINALNADKSEIYQEARSNGFDVKQLRKVIQKRRLPATEREEADAIFDLYWDAIHGAPLTAKKSSAHARVENIEEFPAKAAVQALRADPAMAIVDASNLKKNTGQQAAPQSASDLTASPKLPQGQVATHPEAKTSTDGGATEQDIELPADSVTGEVSRASDGAGPVAPIYAAPGVVTWETFPPEGVERSSVSMAFGNMGQDPVLIQHDLEKGTSQPIVKQGKVILDGWARFMVARDMRELDGQPMSYAVVQYDGSDALIDAIRWNVEGRTLDDHQKKLIAANLTRQNPKRKDDIYRAFEIFLEPV